MTLADAKQLLRDAKIKAVSCELLSDSHFEALIEYYAGDPRTLINRLYAQGDKVVRSATWQWNGKDELQTLWFTLRVA